jgi:hypothetical protein
VLVCDLQAAEGAGTGGEQCERSLKAAFAHVIAEVLDSVVALTAMRQALLAFRCGRERDNATFALELYPHARAL